MKNQTQTKKHLPTKKIILGVLIALSILSILLASFVLFNILFSKKVKSDVLTSSLSDFIILYEDSAGQSILPRGLDIAKSSCRISQDGKTFSYTLGLKNISPVELSLQYQLYYNENYVREYGQRSGNPMSRADSVSPLKIPAGETKDITVTGIILGKDENALETFKEAFSFVYLEVILERNLGRIELPVNIQ